MGRKEKRRHTRSHPEPEQERKRAKSGNQQTKKKTGKRAQCNASAALPNAKLIISAS
jgi:hypothetical protein